MIEFLAQNWYWFVPGGGIVAFAVVGVAKWTAKTTLAVADIVKILQPTVARPAGDQGGGAGPINVVATLIENIPGMATSLKKIADSMHDEKGRPFLRKIAAVTTRTDGRTAKTHNLLLEAVDRQKRMQQKIHTVVKPKSKGR